MGGVAAAISVIILILIWNALLAAAIAFVATLVGMF